MHGVSLVVPAVDSVDLKGALSQLRLWLYLLSRLAWKNNRFFDFCAVFMIFMN